VLVSHGIFHGCDGGLLSARDLLPDRRVISPSRFGYLGSTMPPDATPADQADAFAILLDALGIGRVDVVAFSAGTTAALQFVLRHPDRVQHLAVISGNLPGGSTATKPPPSARVFYGDAPMSAMKVFARPALQRLMGVPAGFPRTTDEAARVAVLVDSIFPVSPRVTGAVFDAYVGDPDVNGYPLEQIGAPTLIVHAKDDPLASYDAAVRAAGRIPHARLVSPESGGHLLLGHDDAVRVELTKFLTESVAGDAR
jgi:pimeloyl-ACP methyl ester carboxylesterase